MYILGIESSCDETAAAVIKGSPSEIQLLSNIVNSQIDIHAQYGGVVPEVAARSHIEVILPVIHEALEAAFPGLDTDEQWSKIDAIGVTHGPGLSGALLVGSLSARTLAWIHNKPLYPINHVLGHVYANFIQADESWAQPQFPLLALIVSGGHSQLMLFQNHFDYQLLGQTEDDAVGEAFDKVAKVLGLAYPGGPSVAKAALQGDPKKYQLPKPRVSNPYGFSFSGLKTAVLRLVQDIAGVNYSFPSFELADKLTDEQVNDVAASFQQTAVEILADRTLLAYKKFIPQTVVIGGGVAASSALRQEIAKKIPIEVSYALPSLCTDNAAMIASLTYFQTQHEQAVSIHDLEIQPNLKV
jgi:N6-L-threonylcarbamoyladenine synthase